MSQSIHNDGNWQRVDTGEWVSKTELDNLHFALTDALVREDMLREANTKLHHELIDCTHDRAALEAQVERLTAPVSKDEMRNQCGFSESGFYRAQCEDIDQLIAARGSQLQNYESALRAGMRQNYAQEADRAVDRLLDEKERI